MIEKQKRKRDRNNKITNLRILAEKLQDYPAIAEVNNLAFGQENEAKLIDKIRQSDRFISQLSLISGKVSYSDTFKDV